MKKILSFLASIFMFNSAMTVDKIIQPIGELGDVGVNCETVDVT